MTIHNVIFISVIVFVCMPCKIILNLYYFTTIIIAIVKSLSLSVSVQVPCACRFLALSLPFPFSLTYCVLVLLKTRRTDIYRRCSIFLNETWFNCLLALLSQPLLQLFDFLATWKCYQIFGVHNNLGG